VLLLLTVHFTTCTKPMGILRRVEQQQLDVWWRHATAPQKTNLWTACSYHFSSTRVLSVVILESTSNRFNFYAGRVVSHLITLLNIPIILTVGHVKFLKRYTPSREHSHLLVAPNSSSLNLYLERDKSEYPQNTWRQKENFLILVLSTDIVTTSDYHEIFDRLWDERGILNVLILIKSLKKTNMESILAYNPFLVDKLNGKTLMWVVQPEKIHDLPKTYVDRTSNLLGHTLNVSMFNDRPTATLRYEKFTNRWISGGRDGRVLNIIAAYMNFTPVIIRPANNEKIGYRTKNGTFTGAMADLINRRTHIAVNEIYLKYYGTNEIEFAVPAIRNQQVVVLVPKSAKIHIWVTVYKALKSIYWQYALTSFFSCAVVWHLLRRFHSRRNLRRGHEACLFRNILEMLAIFLSMPLSFLTKTKSSHQRLLLSSCLIFSWFTMYSFQGFLLDVVANPHFDMDIDTLQQLDEAGIPIVTENPNLLDTFTGSESVGHLTGKLTYELDYLSVLSRMNKYKNVSLLCSKKRALWFMKLHGNRKLHIVQESPRAYFMSYMVPKGSPYLPRLHVLFGRIAQAGLVDKWDEDTNYEMKLEAAPELGDSNSDIAHKSLKLSDVAVGFIILALGLAVCVIIFLVELCIFCNSCV